MGAVVGTVGLVVTTGVVVETVGLVVTSGRVVGATGLVVVGGVVVGAVVSVVGAVVGSVVGSVRGGTELVGGVLPTVVAVLTVVPKVVTVVVGSDVSGVPVVPGVEDNSAGKQAAILVNSSTITNTNIHFFTGVPPFGKMIYVIITSAKSKSNRFQIGLQKIKGMP